jgi:PIF1-like helicase
MVFRLLVTSRFGMCLLLNHDGALIICQQTGLDVSTTMDCLMKYVDGLESSGRSSLNIPLRSDGSAYEINDLADDQKVAMAEVIGRIKEYCQNTGGKTLETKRLTIAGVAGSGKSTWINTLVAAVRTLFNRNDVISVFGPTGSAAFNAGGETINRGFRIPIDIVSMEIGSKRKFLLDKYKFSICLIIDERSMLEADKLGLMRHYMTQCGHLGLNSNREWGGIPLIILVGDDYQLPSINYGAFYSLPGVWINNPSFTRPAKLTSRLAGFEEF